MSICEDAITKYLEDLTDTLLPIKAPSQRPIVGESRQLIDLILNVKKANFVLEAHTGAGKTTFGLTLYHKVRLGEIQRYDVIVVRTSYVKRAIGGGIKELLKVIFDHNSNEHKKSSASVYSTTDLKLECRSLYECIDKYYSSRGKGGKDLIVVLDELELAYGWDETTNTLIEWFSETRKYYDESGAIPVKLVILLPKVIRVRDLTQGLQAANPMAYVFTEFRELKIDEEVLVDYIRKLNGYISPVFGKLLPLKEFKRLLKVLIPLQSGRWIFPFLRKAIAKSICNAVNNQLKGSVEETLEALATSGVSLPDIRAEEVLDKFIIGIVEGMPFKASSRAYAIQVWLNGFTELCKKILETQEIPQPMKIGFQDFILPNLRNNTLIWLSLRKTINKDVILEVVGKVVKELNLLGTVSKLKVILLYPTFTLAPLQDVVIESKGVGKGPTTKGTTREVKLELTFRYRALNAEELAAIISIGGVTSLDKSIADVVISELADDIKALQVR
jgi:hypothetical protein